MRSSFKKTFDNPEYLAYSRRYDNKCLCSICVCGKHRCPQKGIPLETQTTNNFFYKPYEISPQKRDKPQNRLEPSRYDPQVMQSSYNRAYTPHKIQRQSPSKMRNNESPAKIKFQGQTQYKEKFIPKQSPERLRTSPAKQYAPNPAPFEGYTTYNREFSPKRAEGSSPLRRQKTAYQPTPFPLQSRTTYKDQYPPKQIQPNRNLSPSPKKYNPNTTKFQGQTRYRQVNHSLQSSINRINFNQDNVAQHRFSQPLHEPALLAKNMCTSLHNVILGNDFHLAHLSLFDIQASSSSS